MTGLYHSKDINDINPTERVEIELLLEGLNKLYGYDFRDYVFSSIRRRIWYRIRAEGLKTVSGLQEKIFYDSACLNRLLTDFSIQVTEMFRDPLLGKRLYLYLENYPKYVYGMRGAQLVRKYILW